MEQNLPAKEIKTITLYNQKTNQYEVWNPFTGDLVSTSADSALKEDMAKGFTEEKAQAIASLVREGNSFPKISRMPNMPSLQILYYWKRNFEVFAKLVKEAREDRADLLFEKYIDLAENSDEYSEAEMRAVKTKVDAWRYAAEKLAPKDYGNQKERDGGDSALQISIYTGIVRDEPVTVTVNDQEVSDG